MLSDVEITAGANRLVADKLTNSDVVDLVTSLRLLLGPLEANYPTLKEDIAALDDSTGDERKAAKMAACLIRLKNEDFGVALISSTLVNDDNVQRRLFLLYTFGIIYPIPLELSDPEIYARAHRRYSQRVDVVTIP